MPNAGGLISSVKINKNELLEVIKQNLKKHEEDIKEALSLRRTQIVEELSSVLNEIKESEVHQPKESYHFPIPKDNSDEYKKAIRMIEMTQDLVIELDEGQFERLVLDKWFWKNELRTTSALYGKFIE